MDAHVDGSQGADDETTKGDLRPTDEACFEPTLAAEPDEVRRVRSIAE
jgi:hypothetical protein